MNDNVLFMTVPSPERGHRALEALRQAHADGDLTLREGAVIARDAEGALDFPDAVDNTGSAHAFAMGGLLGGLLGILGGPLGVMIGFGAGGLVGGLHDAREATASNAALEMLAAEVPPGATVLMAEIQEDGPEPVDRLLEPFGEVRRYPAEQVRAEVEAAIKASPASGTSRTSGAKPAP
ncbi:MULTISPECIES: DUF1269 domain-containing protein [Streptomyces]|uniref:DUF1269 domain-containing protein n=1 Tax=Streptomyces morookaense TaxID=1970 RepID=A0A7Y7B4X6_STRMO|nr:MULTISPECIES: DUF1269 domain-containing protein [Streptomyces]MCC2278401.1 DUF1269 domain-containing protein [Streptomyces sp. ET3-23]NVK79072.1 DUF1269 domain-containing protein [Streptomyces morookaense]GHF10133.1 hypothetical protein GCM10010359_09540 [Streptomyces morookaense]